METINKDLTSIKNHMKEKGYFLGMLSRIHDEHINDLITAMKPNEAIFGALVIKKATFTCYNNE